MYSISILPFFLVLVNSVYIPYQCEKVTLYGKGGALHQFASKDGSHSTKGDERKPADGCTTTELTAVWKCSEGYSTNKCRYVIRETDNLGDQETSYPPYFDYLGSNPSSYPCTPVPGNAMELDGKHYGKNDVFPSKFPGYTAYVANQRVKNSYSMSRREEALKFTVINGVSVKDSTYYKADYGGVYVEGNAQYYDTGIPSGFYRYEDKFFTVNDKGQLIVDDGGMAYHVEQKSIGHLGGNGVTIMAIAASGSIRGVLRFHDSHDFCVLTDNFNCYDGSPTNAGSFPIIFSAGNSMGGLAYVKTNGAYYVTLDPAWDPSGVKTGIIVKPDPKCGAYVGISEDNSVSIDANLCQVPESSAVASYDTSFNALVEIKSYKYSLSDIGLDFAEGTLPDKGQCSKETCEIDLNTGCAGIINGAYIDTGLRRLVYSSPCVYAEHEVCTRPSAPLHLKETHRYSASKELFSYYKPSYSDNTTTAQGIDGEVPTVCMDNKFEGVSVEVKVENGYVTVSPEGYKSTTFRPSEVFLGNPLPSEPFIGIELVAHGNICTGTVSQHVERGIYISYREYRPFIVATTDLDCLGIVTNSDLVEFNNEYLVLDYVEFEEETDLRDLGLNLVWDVSCPEIAPILTKVDNNIFGYNKLLRILKTADIENQVNWPEPKYASNQSHIIGYAKIDTISYDCTGIGLSVYTDESGQTVIGVVSSFQPTIPLKGAENYSPEGLLMNGFGSEYPFGAWAGSKYAIVFELSTHVESSTTKTTTTVATTSVTSTIAITTKQTTGAETQTPTIPLRTTTSAPKTTTIQIDNSGSKVQGILSLITTAIFFNLFH